MVAYDQVKAYDCVQAFTIKASLERFNLPEKFIRYVLSNLENATSCFKTFYGPTREISVETSVRQGDPLSPLIYILVSDALHEGLANNPIFARKTGYSFSNDSSLTIASTGYADDTMTYSESWEAMWMSHEWVREFCHVHHTKINANKTKYIVSDSQGENDPRWLPSVDGKDKIIPLASSYQIRYLGLWLWTLIEVPMASDEQNYYGLEMEGPPCKSRSRATEVLWLLPRLDCGLLHATITERMCNAWLSTILHTLCSLSDMRSFSSINKKAFCLLAGLPDLWMRLHTTRAAELLVNLNTNYCLCGNSTIARFCSLMGTTSRNIAQAMHDFEPKGTCYTHATNRMSSTLKYLKESGITFANRRETAKSPSRLSGLIAGALSNCD